MPVTPIAIGSIKSTPLGEVWAALSDQGLIAVEYAVTRREFEATLRKITREDLEYAPEHTQLVTQQIKSYLEGKRRRFDLKIDWSKLASDFQRLALKAVFAIPYGEVRTYSQIAAQIGYPPAPRAVGRANATNPIPLVIPCHRVIGSDGKLHGYGGAGGIKTKAWLLKLEKAIEGS